MSIQPIEWLGDKVRILDQTRLPQKEVYLETADYRVVASAIKEAAGQGSAGHRRRRGLWHRPRRSGN